MDLLVIKHTLLGFSISINDWNFLRDFLLISLSLSTPLTFWDILGALFRSSAKSVQERNLMIFLRPTILRDSITTKDLSEEKFNLIRAKQLLKEEESSD